METIELCKTLIESPSVTSDTTVCNQLLDYVTKYIEQYRRDIYIRKYICNGRRSALFTTKDSLKLEFLMVGHLDVVPAGKEAFFPKVVGNKIYGRGGADMKGVVSAMINSFIKSSVSQNIGLYLSTDEEEGGFDGAGFITRNPNLKYKTVFVPDSLPNWTLTTSQKGFMVIEVNAFGKAAHSCEPTMGKNAIKHLIAAYQYIESQLDSMDSLKEVSMSLNQVAGGTAINQVPASAWMSIDFRYTDKEDKKEILKVVRRSCKLVSGLEYQIKVEGEPVNLSYENPICKKFITVLEQMGIPYKLGKESGSSDARFFTKAESCIMFMPICDGAHENLEWIDIHSLQLFEVITDNLIVSICK